MTAKEIRQRYLDFFKQRNHTIIPSSSLIPENDSTLLFTNSGMFPLVPFLLGEKHPGGVRLADSQKSFRMGDIEEVGDNRHNTFFEMLGNWSLGDYFKEEQLNWWLEFVVEELKLDPNRIYQTVYAGDDSIGVEKDTQSVEILKKIFAKYGIEAEEGPETLTKGEQGPGVELDFSRQRIFAYRDKNWWQRGDAVGELGGPDSETFYDTGKTHDPKFGKFCHPNCDCGRFLEIGNSVFMQYQKAENGWKELPNKNVDFGGGLERLAMVSLSKDNIFETDLFLPIIAKIEELSGKKYRDNQKAFEIIADHLKATTFIMSEDAGIVPSNVDQGYILRRLIRRAIRYGRQVGITKESWLLDVTEKVREVYRGIYPELEKNKEKVNLAIQVEEEKFNKTLERGLKELEAIFDVGPYVVEKTKDSERIITGENAFDLYQNYGFPLEMFFEELDKTGIAYEKKEIEDSFKVEFKRHQDLSRTASAGKFKGGLADAGVETTKLHTAAHLMLEALRRVLGSHVVQKGSNITAERLRFDFSHGEKMTPEQIKQVEDLVNEQIEKDLPVTCEEMTLDEAKQKEAMGVFESKYGEKVKVYTIGGYSKEICGGPHVVRTGELGHFKIKKEESSSAGVRRIKAVLE